MEEKRIHPEKDDDAKKETVRLAPLVNSRLQLPAKESNLKATSSESVRFSAAFDTPEKSKLRTVVMNDDENEENDELNSNEEIAKLERPSLASTDSHKSGSSLSLFDVLSLGQAYTRIRIIFIRWYYRNISLRLESLLHLTLLTPFVMAVALLLSLNEYTFANQQTAEIILILIILLGLTALSGLPHLNRRRSQLKCISKIAFRQATIEEVLNSWQSNDYPLTILGITFNICLLIAHFAGELHPVYSQLGYGQVPHLANNLSSIKTSSTGKDLFFAAVGAEIACGGCSGIQKDTINVTPVGQHFMRYVGHDVESVVLPGSADVVRTDTQCTMLPQPVETCNTTKICIDPINSSVYTTLHITSYNSTAGFFSTRLCSVSALDLRSDSYIKYSINDIGFSVRKNVDYIKPLVPETCVEYGTFCLNRPKRKDIGYTFFNLVFNDTILINTKIARDGGLFPDPSDTLIDDKTFSTVISKFLGALVMICSLDFTEKVKYQVLYDDKTAVKLVFPNWLSLSSIIICLLTIFYAIVTYAIAVLQLQKFDNAFLRRLHSSICPGVFLVEAFSKYAQEQLEMKNTRWDTNKAFYGEDKNTRSLDTGILRFSGNSKDIIRYRPGRDYRK